MSGAILQEAEQAVARVRQHVAEHPEDKNALLRLLMADMLLRDLREWRESRVREEAARAEATLVGRAVAAGRPSYPKATRAVEGRPNPRGGRTGQPTIAALRSMTPEQRKAALKGAPSRAEARRRARHAHAIGLRLVVAH